MAGIDAAQEAGLRVKLNTVALKGVNEDEIETLIDWAHGRGMDLTLIETMPLGDIEPTASTSTCRCRSCGRACPDGTRSTTSTIARADPRATCG